MHCHLHCAPPASACSSSWGEAAMRMFVGAAALMLMALIMPVFADVASSYSVTGLNDDGSSYSGDISFTATGQIYRVSFTSDDDLKGIAIEYKDYLVIAERGGDGGGDLGIYKRSGDAWIGVFSEYDEGNLGAEVLHNGVGPELPKPEHVRFGDPTGEYIISGTNPDGSTYTGEVEVTRWGDAFDVDRTIGDEETTGTAVAFGNAFAMNVTEGDDTPRAAFGVVGIFLKDGNGLLGVWAKPGSQKIGAERWV